MTKNEIRYRTNEYRNLHQRLRYWHGKANRCENPNCDGKSKRYDWALKEGRTYSDNIEDYQMLCRVCHCIQDMIRGEEHFQAKLTEENVRFIKKNAGRITQKEMAEKFGVCRQTISLIVTNKNWKQVTIHSPNT